MTPAEVAALALNATVTDPAGATAKVTYTQAWLTLPGDEDGIIELTWQTPLAALGRKSAFNYNDPIFFKFVASVAGPPPTYDLRLDSITPNSVARNSGAYAVTLLGDFGTGGTAVAMVGSFQVPTLFSTQNQVQIEVDSSAYAPGTYQVFVRRLLTPPLDSNPLPFTIT